MAFSLSTAKTIATTVLTGLVTFLFTRLENASQKASETIDRLDTTVDSGFETLKTKLDGLLSADVDRAGKIGTELASLEAGTVKDKLVSFVRNTIYVGPEYSAELAAFEAAFAPVTTDK